MSYCKKLPVVWEQQERHGNSSLCIKIYQKEKSYLYSATLKMGKLIKSIYPTENTPAYTTKLSAQNAASFKIQTWIKTPYQRRELSRFNIKSYQQLDLF